MMLFDSCLLALAAMAALARAHVAESSRSPVPIVLRQLVVANRTVTVYGDANADADADADEAASPARGRLSRRFTLHWQNWRDCGKNKQIECYPNNLADVAECDLLIGPVLAQMLDEKIPNGVDPARPRSICTRDCCISWDTRWYVGSTMRDLLPAAQVVRQRCVRYGNKVSGLSRDARLNDDCAVQCLSNRPFGCN